MSEESLGAQSKNLGSMKQEPYIARLKRMRDEHRQRLDAITCAIDELEASPAALTVIEALDKVANLPRY